LTALALYLHSRADFMYITGLLVHAHAMTVLQQTGSGREASNAST